MPKLDARLQCVAKCIRSRIHADIGSDHGHLLKALLASGRIERGIAVELHTLPLANSQRTLRGWNADVRLGDGLQPLMVDEADSLSVCGLGGRVIAEILRAGTGKVPPTVIVQPNGRAECVRRWGLSHGYHLTAEHIVGGRRIFEVLCFTRAENRATASDPAYANIDRELAIWLGPWHLRHGEPAFIERLQDDRDYLSKLPQRNAHTQSKLDAIKQALAARAVGPTTSGVASPWDGARPPTP